MDHGLLPSGEMPDGPVGISVSCKEPALKEDHAGDPYRGGAAEGRKDHLGDHRLDLEEKKGAEEYGEGKGRYLDC